MTANKEQAASGGKVQAWLCTKERDAWNPEGTAKTGKKYTARRILESYFEAANLQRNHGWSVTPLYAASPSPTASAAQHGIPGSFVADACNKLADAMGCKADAAMREDPVTLMYNASVRVRRLEQESAQQGERVAELENERDQWKADFEQLAKNAIRAGTERDNAISTLTRELTEARREVGELTKQVGQLRTELAEVRAGSPDAWQYRWTNPAGDRVHKLDVAWKPMLPRGTETLEQRAAELHSYTYNGVPCYEVRKLYATSSKGGGA